MGAATSASRGGPWHPRGLHPGKKPCTPALEVLIPPTAAQTWSAPPRLPLGVAQAGCRAAPAAAPCRGRAPHANPPLEVRLGPFWWRPWPLRPAAGCTARLRLASGRVSAEAKVGVGSSGRVCSCFTNVRSSLSKCLHQPDCLAHTVCQQWYTHTYVQRQVTQGHLAREATGFHSNSLPPCSA